MAKDELLCYQLIQSNYRGVELAINVSQKRGRVISTNNGRKQVEILLVEIEKVTGKRIQREGITNAKDT